MFLEWEEKYSVKVRELDEQHKKLFSIINDMSEAVERGEGLLVSLQIIESMASYAKTHFLTEEKYMQAYGFSDIAEQKDDHEYFIERIDGFKKGLENRKLGLPEDVMEFLKNWWVGHILHKDMKYSAFFNEKGLT